MGCGFLLPKKVGHELFGCDMKKIDFMLPFSRNLYYPSLHNDMSKPIVLDVRAEGCLKKNWFQNLRAFLVFLSIMIFSPEPDENLSHPLFSISRLIFHLHLSLLLQRDSVCYNQQGFDQMIGLSNCGAH